MREPVPPYPVRSGVKKLLIVLGAIFLAIVVAGLSTAAWVFFNPGKARQVLSGQSGLLDYLGAQVVGIANTHLVPELSYETIRYDPPYTLALGGVRLTADDGTRVLDLGQMTVVLAETPALNQPIKVASLTLANGAVNLINDPASGGLRGLSPLVEPGPERDAASPQFRLESVLRLDKIVIDAIDLVYDAGDGSPPMRLDALNAQLDIVPATDARAGWYELDLASGREPGLRLELDGRVNINSFELDLTRVTAQAQLDDQTATTLPPRLAAVVNKHQVRGAMRAEVSGRVPLLDPAEAQLDVQATLDDGRAVFGEYRIPIDSLSIDADMSSGLVVVRSIALDALGGAMTGSGRMNLADDASFSWDIKGMELRELLASRPADQPPKMAGLVASSGSVRFPLKAPMGGLSGAGTLGVTQGRLVNIPVFSDLMRVAQVTGLTSSETLNDSFVSPFTLSPDGVYLDGFDFRTPALAARGSGTVGFDGGLDITANGGPVESLQNKLGKFGAILGKITDLLVTYHIQGTVSEPRISVQPLGIGG